MTAPIRAALLAVLATSALALAPAAVRADNSAAATAGEAKAAVCTACHGVNGNSVNPEWPNLAGQGSAYINEQLKLFRAGHRNNLVMYPLAVALTDDDIRDLAAYYSRQTPTGLEADPATVKAGEALYRGGDRARNIPSCASCHGPRGLGMTTAGYPKLRGQHATYTIKALNDYAAEQRYVDVNSGEKTRSRNGHMMTSIAKRLTDEDKAALASYIQGLR
ncbi:MAG: c-type cytochrome [Gammaproteobacteria bacterium]|jgi:cytochrome c553